MKAHTKIYLNHFKIGEQDKPYCEVCGNIAVDVHHIYYRSMGGRKTFTYKDKEYDINDIINLIGLCRSDHEKAHTGEHSKGFLILAHRYKLYGIVFQHRK